jgi:hypothetical protein
VVVERGDVTSNAASVSYTTANGTASSGSDYLTTSGTLDFDQGQQFAIIEVQLAKDAVFEGTENFFINLSNPVGTTINDGQAAIALYDDDYLFGQAAVNGGGLMVSSPTTDFAADLLPGTTISTESHVDLSKHGSVMLGTPEALFQTAHLGGTWDFSVTSGATYEVRLYFAEISPTVDSTGDRVFDVLIEGINRLNDYDIFSDAAGANIGVMKTFIVTAVGSSLTVDFVGVTGNPLISAIEIFRV